MVDEEIENGTPEYTGWIAAGDAEAWALWLEGSGAATIGIDVQVSPVQPNDRKRDPADSYDEISVSASASYDEWLAMPATMPVSFGQMRFKVSVSATITCSLALACKTE